MSAICAPAPSQYAALAALTGPTEPIRQMRDALNARRKLCCRRLDALTGLFDYVAPRGAFYIMARYLFTDTPSRQTAVRLLNEARVITIPGGSFGPGGEGHLRLSYGGTVEEIETAFDRIDAWLIIRDSALLKHEFLFEPGGIQQTGHFPVPAGHD